MGALSAKSQNRDDSNPWDKDNWSDKEKVDYVNAKVLTDQLFGVKKRMEARGEWPRKIPFNEDVWNAMSKQEQKFEIDSRSEFINSRNKVFKYLSDHPTLSSWAGFEAAFRQKNKNNAPHTFVWDYSGNWIKAYEEWITRHECSVLFDPSESQWPSYNAISALRWEKEKLVFNFLLNSPSMNDYDKVEVLHLFLGGYLFNGLLSNERVMVIDEDVFLKLIGHFIDQKEVVQWNYMTFSQFGIRQRPDAKNPGKFIPHNDTIHLPIVNTRFCDFAAEIIWHRYQPKELIPPYQILSYEAEQQEHGMTQRPPPGTDPWPITTWPGWKKMPAMQDAYVAKAKAWLENYKKKRAAAAGLRDLLRNPQAAELSAKTWQSSWETLVLLEAKSPGYNDQRFDLLAEAFLREAMNPKAPDRQQRQSCISGAIMQMFLDEKNPMDPPAGDMLTKPQRALDWLTVSVQ